MLVKKNNLTMFRGNTERLRITVRGEPGPDGEPGEVTPLVEGDTAYFTVRDPKEWGEEAIEKIVEEFNDDGSVTFVINTKDTNTLKPGAYEYDVRVKKNNEIKTIIPTEKDGVAKFFLLKEVTNL